MSSWRNVERPTTTPTPTSGEGPSHLQLVAGLAQLAHARDRTPSQPTSAAHLHTAPFANVATTSPSLSSTRAELMAPVDGRRGATRSNKTSRSCCLWTLKLPDRASLDC